MTRTPDAVVVGGGLVGCLVARALADDGRAVVLVERGAELGREASSAAAGLLSPQMESAAGILVTGSPETARRHEAMLALCLAARAAYGDFVRRLEAETGHDVHYRPDGTLAVALADEEAGFLAQRAEEQRTRGLRAEWLDGDGARAIEPAITATAVGALHLPDDYQLDNVALVEAAAAAVRARRGIEVRTGTPALGLVVDGGRVAGVRTPGGVVAAGFVVLAAGAWSSGIEGAPRRVAVRPVKGQMAALRPPSPPFRRVVGGRGVYCVPRDDGRVLVGATVEEAGFDKTVDPGAVDRLVAAAAAIVPALHGADVHTRWAGLRPGTADDLPLIGLDAELGGLVWATGHFRNGILLAPLTAGAVAALLRGDAPPVDLTPFRPDRSVAPLPPGRLVDPVPLRPGHGTDG